MWHVGRGTTVAVKLLWKAPCCVQKGIIVLVVKLCLRTCAPLAIAAPKALLPLNRVHRENIRTLRVGKVVLCVRLATTAHSALWNRWFVTPLITVPEVPMYLLPVMPELTKMRRGSPRVTHVRKDSIV